MKPQGKNFRESPASTILGTGRYVAPEMLTGEPYDGSKGDIWACGVMLFLLRECQYPFRFTNTGGVGQPGMREPSRDTLTLKQLLERAQCPSLASARAWRSVCSSEVLALR